jgi:hypothetical protein
MSNPQSITQDPLLDGAPAPASPAAPAGAVVLAACLGGAIAPMLTFGVELGAPASNPLPIAAAAAFAALVAAAPATGPGRAGPRGPRALLGAASGALAGLAAPLAAAGLGHAILGLGVGLALTPPGRRFQGALVDALAVAAGTVLGGVLAGLVLPALVGLPAAFGGASLGLCLGLGVALGVTAARTRTVDLEPPAEVVALAKALVDPEAKSLLQVALDAHRRCAHLAKAGRGSGCVVAPVTRDLLLQAAAGARAAERALLASRSLGGDQAGANGLAPELDAARARLGAALATQRREGLAAASRHATALTHLAATLVEQQVETEADLALATDPLPRLELPGKVQA